MDMFPLMVKELKGMCAYMRTFIRPRDPFYYQTSLFLTIFGTFKADLGGLFMI